MIFTSLNYILFFVVVMILFNLLPNWTWKKIFLLTTSYYYCFSFEPICLLILLFDTFIIYLYGKSSFVKLERHLKGRITTSVILLLLFPLIFYKYFNFFTSTIVDACGLVHVQLSLPKFEFLLPIGISFYTFQAIGYVLDVYKGKIQAERNFLDIALFLGFFPQISAGPIGRAPLLLPQFKEERKACYDNVVIGFKWILWGLFMKLVVGDRAGIYVDTIFPNYMHHSGPSLIMATFMYTIQIYCDFAGYSLVAIGCARCMGFELMHNFMRPYFALNVTDFWRRWHISLSTWFRDYVYIPLGGSREGNWKTYRNLMITFIVSGVWHGAAYNFILWGVLHGLFQVIGKVSDSWKLKCWNLMGLNKNSRFYRIINIIETFCLVAYAWLIFKVADIHAVWEITKGYFKSGSLYIHQTTLFFFVIGFSILFFKDWKDEFYPNKHYFLYSKFAVIRYLTCVTLIVFIMLIGVLNGGQFIYFQF